MMVRLAEKTMVAGAGRSRDPIEMIDRHIGQRLRERRVTLGLTTEQMAQLIGVTYSQVRKYEKGINRIAAGRLYNMAEALGVEVGYFFEGIHAGERSVKATPQQRMLLELARHFISIPQRQHQEIMVLLARALSMLDEPPISARKRQEGLATLQGGALESDKLADEDADRRQIVRLTAPVRFIAKLMETWALGESDAARLLGLEGQQDVRDLLLGAKQLDSRDVKDRVRQLLRMREALHSLFRDIGTEREWLREPRPELNDQSPLDLLLEGSMENFLIVTQFVQWMAGR
jgi:transcriptional regulator with XRE-family HTH domain